MCDNQVAMHH